MVAQLAREAGAYVIGTGRAADRQAALDFGSQEFVDLEHDSLGDVGAALKYADPDHLGGLCEKLNVELVYEPTGRTVVASVSLRVVSACPRGDRLML